MHTYACVKLVLKKIKKKKRVFNLGVGGGNGNRRYTIRDRSSL